MPIFGVKGGGKQPPSGNNEGDSEKDDKDKELDELEEILFDDEVGDQIYNDPSWSQYIPKTPHRQGGSGYNDGFDDDDGPDTDKVQTSKPKPRR